MSLILRRWNPIAPEARAAAGADKPVQVVSSTDVALRRGRWIEILSHDPGAITDGARSVLKNHNPDVVVGKILSSANDGHAMRDAIEFAPTAAAKDEETLVRGGFIEGISVGYSIDEYTRTEESDGDLITIRAVKWTRREISTTPTPADLAAGVESRSTSAGNVRALDDSAAFERMLAGARDVTPSTRSTTPAAPAASPESRTVTTPTAPAPAPVTPAPVTPAPASPDAALVARAEKAERTVALVELARSHNVTLTAEEAGACADRAAGLELILARKASAETSAPQRSLAGEIRVTAHEADKVRASAIDALGFRSGTPDKKDGGMRRMRSLEIARRCAVAMGVPGARDWDEETVADYASRQGEFRGRAYGVADFPVILANVAQVNLSSGFQGAGNTWEKWTRRIMVPNTLAGKVGGLASGRFGRPSGGTDTNPLPALTLADGGATLTAAMGGGQIIITRTALLADSLGEILRRLTQAGAIASDTIEADAFKALIDADYTGAITLSADLGASGGAAAAVALGVADFMAKTDPAAKLIGARPRFLLCAPAHIAAVWAAINPVVGSSDSAFRFLEAVPSAYLASHPDTTNESADNWHLAADPSRIDGIVVGTVYDVPQVYEMDPGGVAGIGLRIEFPWGVANVGTYGLQKCKKAAS